MQSAPIKPFVNQKHSFNFQKISRSKMSSQSLFDFEGFLPKAKDAKKPVKKMAEPSKTSDKMLVKKPDVMSMEEPNYFVWATDDSGFQLFEPAELTDSINLNGCWGSGNGIAGEDQDSILPEATLVNPLEVEGRSFVVEEEDLDAPVSAATPAVGVHQASPFAGVVASPSSGVMFSDANWNLNFVDYDSSIPVSASCLYDDQSGLGLMNMIFDDNIGIDEMLNDVDEVVCREMLDATVIDEDADVKIEPVSPDPAWEESLQPRRPRRSRARTAAYAEPNEIPVQ